jgi:arylsulfatase A-like enzyme
MIRWPGKVQPGERPELANSIDLAPTILKACGLEPTDTMQGIDLLDDTALAKRKSTHGACYLHNAIDIHKPSANLTHRWLINGNWKLILPNKANAKADAPELYNLTQDPHEHQNLAKRKQTKTKRLAEQLNKLLPER